MKKIFLLPFFTLFCFFAYGQNDSISIKQQILNSPTPKTELISKGRNLIIDRLIANDLIRVKEAKDYLVNEVEDNYYLAIHPVELWLINYLVGDYEQISVSILALNEEYKIAFQEKIKPPRDILFQKLKVQNVEVKTETFTGIENSNLSNERKDFLKMHLNYLLSDDEYNQQEQDKLNLLADDFLLKYENSPFQDYTRQYIRYKLVTSDWAFGFEFFTGASFYTQNLGERYSSSASFGIAFDIGYKNWMMYLRNHLGGGSTLVDIPDSDNNYVWLKGANYTMFQPELSLGYILFDGNKIRFAPFAGIASTDISPPTGQSSTNPELKNFELPFTYTYSVGFTIDFKLKRLNYSLISYGQEEAFWFIRVRYGYTMPQFERKHPHLIGDIHYLNIGIGGIGSKVKRDI
jgi:hypothetical protein